MNRSPERTQFLADIIVGAVEGGTGYWAYASGYHWSDDKPDATRVTLIPMDDEDEPRQRYDVTLETVVTGLNNIINSDHFVVNPRTKETIRQADAENDGGLIDAECADVIVQVGLWGQIVYGG